LLTKKPAYRGRPNPWCYLAHFGWSRFPGRQGRPTREKDDCGRASRGDWLQTLHATAGSDAVPRPGPGAAHGRSGTRSAKIRGLGAACGNSDRRSAGTVIDRCTAYGYHAACPQQSPAVVRKKTKLIPAGGLAASRRSGSSRSRQLAGAVCVPREVLPIRPIEFANAGGITVRPETQYLRTRAVAGYCLAALVAG